MESTEAINIPVNSKDAHKHDGPNNDEISIKNVQHEPLRIDATGTNIENTIYGYLSCLRNDLF